MTIKTTMVPKQPPPNFQAPTPEISPLRRLFMIVQVYVHFILFFIYEISEFAA
jgi:hypothetical protein